MLVHSDIQKEEKKKGSSFFSKEKNRVRNIDKMKVNILQLLR